MTGARPDEQTREVAYAEFLKSRGKYTRAASFLDADRRREIEHGETQLDERLESRELGTRQPEPARL